MTNKKIQAIGIMLLIFGVVMTVYTFSIGSYLGVFIFFSLNS